MTKNRLDHTLSRLKQLRQKAFIPYIMAGDFGKETTLSLLTELAKISDIIELGFAFSDPMADGPIIQAATKRALSNGISLKKTLNIVGMFRQQNQTTPLILMGYYNPIFVYGVEAFIEDALGVGVDGLIIVDCPQEEDCALFIPAYKKSLPLIRLATPTTSLKRFQKMIKHAKGFIYYVSVAGITGTKEPDIRDIKTHIEKLRLGCDMPFMIGFGIKTPHQAQNIAKLGHGIVLGSRLIEEMTQAPKHQLVERVFGLAQKFSLAIKDKKAHHQGKITSPKKGATSF